MLKGILDFFRGKDAGPQGALPIPLEQVTQFLSPGPPLEGNDPSRPIPRWPEHGAAMIAAEPATLLETQRELLAAIRQSSPMSPAQFAELLMPVFERYAAWVHLLPASESHHHSGPGGLLAHGLEVAMHAARIADGKTVGLEFAPSERARFEPRWKVACMLAGLMHDIGKPLVDVGATDPERTHEWPAASGPLYAWLRANKLSHYRFFWRAEHRHEAHKPVGTSVLRDIVGDTLLHWLSDEPSNGGIWNHVLQSVAMGKTSGNLLSSIASQADSMSVEADLKRLAEKTRSTGEGARGHVAALVMGELRKLIEEGQAKINEPGEPIYWTDQGLFGLYPETLTRVKRRLASKQINGVPSSLQDLAAMLADTGFIERAIGQAADGAEGKAETWDLTVSVGKGDSVMATPTLRALRFCKPEYVVGALPLPEAVAATAKPPFLSSQELDDAVAQMKVRIDEPASSETSEVAGTPADGQPAADDDTEPTMAGTADADAPREPVIENRRNRPDLARARSQEAQRAQERRQHDREAGETFADLCGKISRVGPEGAAVAHVLQRLGKGQLKWGTDVCQSFGELAIRYPSSFEGTGIPPADLLAKAAQQNWLVTDGGDRKVQDIDFPDGSRAKCMVFTGLVRRAVEVLLVEKPEVATPEGAGGRASGAREDGRNSRQDGAPQASAGSAPTPAPRRQREDVDQRGIGRPTQAEPRPRGPQRPRPDAQAPAAAVARGRSAAAAIWDEHPKPDGADLACKDAKQLTPRYMAQLRSALFSALSKKPELLQAQDAPLREAAVKFCQKFDVAVSLAAMALSSGENPLLTDAAGNPLEDLQGANEVRRNPKFKPQAWVGRRPSRQDHSA